MKEATASPAPSASGRGHEDINARIARQVRARRIELELTLETLAARCRVSRSMLSLIERGESSATAVVLEKIATGLGLPLAALFADSAAPIDPVARRADRIAWRDPQSGYVRRNISPVNFPSPLQIVEVELPAGARVAYESGVRDSSIYQQIWVRQGRLDLSLGRVTYQLEEDDCLAMQLNEATVFRNRTRKLVRYIVVLASERIGHAPLRLQ